MVAKLTQACEDHKHMRVIFRELVLLNVFGHESARFVLHCDVEIQLVLAEPFAKKKKNFFFL